MIEFKPSELPFRKLYLESEDLSIKLESWMMSFMNNIRGCMRGLEKSLHRKVRENKIKVQFRGFLERQNWKAARVFMKVDKGR